MTGISEPSSRPWKASSEDERAEVDAKNLATVVAILRSRGIFFWLDQGTLLGAVRDGAPIPWDGDLDLSCWHADFSRLADLMGEFEGAGFYFELHEYKDCAFLARGEGRTIEIAGQRRDQGFVIRQNALPRNRGWERLVKRGLAALPRSVFFALRAFGRRTFRRSPVVFKTPERFFSSFRTISFLGVEGLPAPRDAEGYLAFKYGADWKVPRKEWDYSRDDGSVSGA
jgi:hypothetical protein